MDVGYGIGIFLISVTLVTTGNCNFSVGSTYINMSVLILMG